MHLDRGPGSVVADRVHDVAGLGKGFAWRKPASRCSERRRTEAAQTKATTREEMSAYGGHYILLHQLGDRPGGTKSRRLKSNMRPPPRMQSPTSNWTTRLWRGLSCLALFLPGLD